MNVHNLMEDVVRSRLKDLMQKQEGLQELSEKAQSDIMAITLNRIPAKYVATAKGKYWLKPKWACRSRRMFTESWRMPLIESSIQTASRIYNRPNA
ncbi:late competence development ComFB family protein [Paenibacillus sp. P26]|nr:late competence development ComFB family protein [Paenibacillus sp. P26]UUZ96100.1 late competence development ComFB family protein [Paenibacillus sp. P25]